jgi:hypothetical protein
MHPVIMSSSITLPLSAELEPPPVPKSKSKKNRANPSSAPKLKRGPPRPHRRLADDVLTTRVERLKKRLERARKQVLVCGMWGGLPIDKKVLTTLLFGQHEDTRRLLTKYLHETTHRLRDSLNHQEEEGGEDDEAAASMPPVTAAPGDDGLLLPLEPLPADVM